MQYYVLQVSKKKSVVIFIYARICSPQLYVGWSVEVRDEVSWGAREGDQQNLNQIISSVYTCQNEANTIF